MGLDELMKKAVDQPDHAHLIHRPVLNGHYELTGVNFKYGEDDPKPSLMIVKLEIKAGEKIAILGRNGAINFVQEKKEGLDHIILEGGVGFSGGQKQALLLSRLLIRQPNILLLDEPTASIDDVSEKQFIEHLKGWLGQKTLLVATHRRAVLELVDRIIVVNDGKVVMDGPRDQILNQNQQPQKVHVVGG